MLKMQSVLQVPAGLRLRRQGQIRPGPRRGQPQSLGLSLRLADAFFFPANWKHQLRKLRNEAALCSKITPLV
jgi:hypothetical protein